MDAVKAQYETYPYPARDPADEDKRLVTGSPSQLDEVRHYLFAGRRPPDPFRVLVAGGGTGDGLIMLAEQCRQAGIEVRITYLDLSAQAAGIAKARAERRGLTGITFETGSLLDAGALAGGPFDYIDCCGVLHHLADPPAGLASLRGVLAEGGGMGLMVYAPYGRTGVYPLQDALRGLTDGLEPEQKVALAKKLIAGLPPTNWFTRNGALADHRNSDAGLYDLLLHSQDRAYTVPQFADLLAGSGLTPVCWLEPARYEPEQYLPEKAMRERCAEMEGLERAALAEQLAGNIKMHTVYAVPDKRTGVCVADPANTGSVPVPRDFDPAALARALPAGRPLPIEFDGLTLRFVMPRMAGAILSAIDGRRSIALIHRHLAGQSKRSLDWPVFKAQFNQLYRSLNGANKLLLRVE